MSKTKKNDDDEDYDKKTNNSYDISILQLQRQS